MNYQEYKQSLNQKLTDKVQKELSAFREEMQGKPPQEIYEPPVARYHFIGI